MDEPWKEVLLENRDTILSSADPHDILLNRVLDHLLAKRCIQPDQKESIRHEQLSRDRFGKLLDVLSSENCTAFDELCNAFRAFNTEDKIQLADKLQQDLQYKKEGRVLSDFEVQQLKAERDQLKTEKDQLQVEKDRLQSERDKLQVEKDRLQSERDKLQVEKDRLQSERDKLQVEKDQLQSERDKLQVEKDRLQSGRDKLQVEKDRLVQRLLIEENKLEESSTPQAATNRRLSNERDQLFKKEREQLRTGLASFYAEVNLIHSMNEEKPIWAMTTLNNKLCVNYDGNTDITLYDTETYSVQRCLQVPRLTYVTDMTSCKRHQCIYIADHVNKVVHRVDNKNTITQWAVNDGPEGLSVNSVYNVLVTCYEVCKVKEFTTDGKLIRAICLASSIVNPRHTVELTTGQLVVCCGEGNDALHRVCIVDLSGRVLQSYGGSKGSGNKQLNAPVRLAVNDKVVFVADRDNHRVLMLSPTLSLIREVVSGLRYPMRMWFNDETGRLYVADNKWENSKYVSG